jgi:malonate transporter
MMNISIIGSLIPIFVVILAGYIFRKVRFPGDDFWSYAERITYFVLFPALLFQKTASASLDFHSLGPMVITLVSTISVIASLIFFIRPWWPAGDAAFTSFFQGGIRMNTYVGLSAAFALFGDEGLTLAAVAFAVWIPLTNVLCVSVLVGFRDSEKKDWLSLLSCIVRNPLILACVAGIMLNLSGIGLNKGVSETLLIFGRASLPLGLMALGAGLDIASARDSRGIIVLNCILKLIVMPMCMWVAAIMLGVGPVATAIAVLFAALPGSPNSYILARQLGGDSLLMANIVTAQVILSMVTLPVIMMLVII